MRRFMILIGLLCAAIGTQAQESALPTSVRLSGMAMVYQDINRCSAAAYTMLVSYFVEERVDYKSNILRLNPDSRDVSVRVEEMVTAAQQQYGLSGIVRRGGTIELLRKLVANGFPVLVENAYFDGNDPVNDWMSHNRVLMGYDDASQTLYFYDSLLGNGTNNEGRPMSYADFEERWIPFNRDYLVLYKPEDTVRMIEILREMWGADANAAWVLEQTQTDLANNPSRTQLAEIQMNQAWALLQLGDAEAAATLYEQTLSLNALPWRYLWYDFGVFEAYLQTGRYDALIDLANTTLANSRGVEELYYYIGKASAALGDSARARNNYEAAVQANPYFTEAVEALATVQ